MYAENLKKIRQKLDLSAAKLAKQLNVATGSIMQYEHGIRTPNYNFMLQLNTVLNINLNWFVSGKGEMFNTNDTPFVNSREEVEKIVLEVLNKKGIK